MSGLSYAACINKGGGVWETDGNEAADVNECVTAASAGNTVNVVAGDGTSTWPANAVTIPANKPLKIMGPGSDQLTITISGGNCDSNRPLC